MSFSKLPHWPPGKTWLRKLSSKKYRKEFGVYLLEGSAAIEDALMQGAEAYGILHDARSLTRSSDQELLDWLQREKYPLRETGLDELQAVSGLSTAPPVLAIMKQAPAQSPLIPVPPGLALALDKVSDPGNVGTLIRVAAFYGIREVWLGEGTAELYNPKTIRAAMAAHLQVRICQPVDLYSACKKAREQGATILASIVENASAPPPLSPDSPTILILGSEAHGMDEKLVSLADLRVAIERRGQVDSLNVAMAGAILVDRLLR